MHAIPIGFDGSSWSHSMQSTRGFSKKGVGHLWLRQVFDTFPAILSTTWFSSCIAFCFLTLFPWSCSGRESQTRFPVDFRVTILLLQLLLEHNQYSLHCFVDVQVLHVKWWASTASTYLDVFSNLIRRSMFHAISEKR